MVFDVLAVGLLAFAWWFALTHRPVSQGTISDGPVTPGLISRGPVTHGPAGAPELGAADLPPPGAGSALPSGRRLTHYVESGLGEIDDFLRRDDTA